MRYVVLDTNCLLASIDKRSKFHSVWTSFLNKTYHLCVSNEIMSEYEEIIARKTSPPRVLGNVLLFVFIHYLHKFFKH